MHGKLAIITIIALISIIVTTFPFSFGVSNIVQVQCSQNASVANDAQITATFNTRPIVGNQVYAVVTVQGSTTQTISYTNVTDNTDNNGLNPQYTHNFRTTDQGNTLIVSFQNYTVDTANAGINFIVSASYHATTNVNNRLLFCIYEISGLKGAAVATSQKSGGSLPQATGTVGIVTLTGAAGNSAGGTYAFSGTYDSSVILGNTFNQGVGSLINNAGGSWSGLTGVTFVIEGDLSIGSLITSTITGFLVPNFVNGISSFSWLYFLLVVFVPMGEIVGIITMERSSVLDRHAIIFIFLALLLLDSIFGVMLNVVTVAMPFIFGILFGIYLWRGRG